MTFNISVNRELPSAQDLEYMIPIGVSYLKTPIYDNITFPSSDVKNLLGISVSFKDLVLNSVQFVVTQERRIVKTPISGRNGTVKEFINTGDYVINASIKLAELLNNFPADQMNIFKDLVSINQSVPIVSRILNDFFDIDRVVIESFKVSPGTGVSNVGIEMTMISDREFNINKYAL